MKKNITKLQCLFIQSEPSQLDSVFYGELARLIPGDSLIILFNSSKNQRQDIDHELGLTPIFPDLNEGYSYEWIALGRWGIFNLLKRVIEYSPKYVVVQDQKWSEKIILALCCRLIGIQVAMRSDKNNISIGKQTGFFLWCECFLVKGLFNRPLSY
ncbi:MAG: hypothetical protein HQ462_10510 [Deltaproteobacteria bacterium]|nr:hypothetical protein [Deltaproteobacteria bacterium]